MVNKKGFLRVIEATVAVIIVIAALLLIESYQESGDSKNLNAILPPLFDEIAKNETLRNSILSGPVSLSEKTIETFLLERIDNPNLDLKAKVCDLDDDCSFTSADEVGEIFVEERVISTT